MPSKLPFPQLADRVVDLNDLRVFAYVASLASFSLAADALKMHKSSVSRSVMRLETVLQTSLLERKTRRVELTRRGKTLRRHSIDILSRVDRTLWKIKEMNEPPPYRATLSETTDT